MKTLCFYLAVVVFLFLCSLTVYSQAQAFTAIYKKAPVESETTEIVVQVASPEVSKIVVINNENYKAYPKDVTAEEKDLFIPVDLKLGENKFIVLAYKGEVPLKTSESLIVIKRNDKPASSGGGGGSGSGATTPSKPANQATIEIGNAGEGSSLNADSPKHVLSIVPSNLPEAAKAYELVNKQADKKSFKYGIQTTKGQPNSPQKIEVNLVQGENHLTVYVLDGNDQRITAIAPAITIINCPLCDVKYRNVNTRAIVGVEQVGASSAASETLPFLNFFLNVPIVPTSKGNVSPFSLWTDFRFSGSAVQNFADLTNLSAGVLNSVSTPKVAVNTIVQTFRVTGGFDIRVWDNDDYNPFFIPGRSSVSFIGGGSITSPLVTSQQTTQIFKIPKLPNGTVNPDFARLFSNINFEGKTNIAFVTPERDRFFRRWFAGMRVRHSFFEDEEIPLDLNPAMLDITFGQDEGITKKLTNKVMTFEGFTPFPLKAADYIYLFGGATIRLTRKVNTNVPAFFLPSAEIINLTNSNDTVIVSADTNPLTLSNRDTFRFGIGIDVIRLFNKTRTP